MKSGRLSIVFMALLGLVGCEDEDGASPLDGAADASVADTAAVDAPKNLDATADATADGPSADVMADAQAPDTQAPDTAPRPEYALLGAELGAIVKTPGHELASLAVLAIDNGSVSYEGHFGSAKIDSNTPANNVAANKDSLYRVASMSKMVTAIGLMILVDEGKVNLDADASTYLGFSLRNPNFPAKVITTRMLLSHLSSIRADENYSFPITQALQDILTPTGANYDSAAWAAADAASSRAPGDYFFYSNLNFGLIGSVIEGASGQRFDKFMQAKVLSPMGITGGYYPADMPAEVVARIATIYRKRNNGGQWNADGKWFAQADDFSTTPPQPIAGLASYVLGKNGTLFGPQGSLRISVSDMGKIMQMLMNNGKHGTADILKPASVALMQANAWTYNGTANNGDYYYGLFRSWGLGMQRFTDTADTDGGDRSVPGFTGVGHLGDAYGLLSGFIFDPVTKDGMIYFIGGVGSKPDDYVAADSGFYKWESDILKALHRRAVSHDATTP